MFQNLEYISKISTPDLAELNILMKQENSAPNKYKNWLKIADIENYVQIPAWLQGAHGISHSRMTHPPEFSWFWPQASWDLPEKENPQMNSNFELVKVNHDSKVKKGLGVFQQKFQNSKLQFAAEKIKQSNQNGLEEFEQKIHCQGTIAETPCGVCCGAGWGRDWLWWRDWRVHLLLDAAYAAVQFGHHKDAPSSSESFSHRVAESLTLYSSLFSSGGPFKWPRRAGGIA